MNGQPALVTAHVPSAGQVPAAVSTQRRTVEQPGGVPGRLGLALERARAHNLDSTAAGREIDASIANSLASASNRPARSRSLAACSAS